MSGGSTPVVPDVVDLTGDDDIPPPASGRAPRQPSSSSARPSASRSPVGDHVPRAPPFGSASQYLEVIDLSDSGDEPEGNEGAAPLSTAHIDLSSSPEVQFLRERPAQTNLNNIPPAHHPARRLPTPPLTFGSRHLPRLPDFITRATRSMFSNSTPLARDVSDLMGEAMMDRIDGLQYPRSGPTFNAGNAAELEIIDVGDDYNNIAMNYTHTAFALNVPRESTPPRIIQEDYKAPPPAKEGFARTWDEESMLVCAFCSDELATGATEIKQQVWVNRACGHVRSFLSVAVRDMC